MIYNFSLVNILIFILFIGFKPYSAFSANKITLLNDSVIYGIKVFEYDDTLDIIDIHRNKLKIYTYNIKSEELQAIKFELKNGKTVIGFITNILDKNYYINQYNMPNSKTNITMYKVDQFILNSDSITKISLYNYSNNLCIGLYLGYPTYVNALIHYKPITDIGIKFTGSYSVFGNINNGYQIGTFYSIVAQENGEINLGLLKGYYNVDFTLQDRSVHYAAFFLDIIAKPIYFNLGYHIINNKKESSGSNLLFNIGVLYYL